MRYLYFLFIITVQQYFIHVDGLICVTPTLNNGWSRTRLRGRYIRFGCFPPYNLVGDRSANCLKGRLDKPTPICTLPIVRLCDTPFLKNGRIRLRGRGKFVRFECYAPYKLIGDKNADCLQGRWDNPIPMCLRSGCQQPSPIDYGFIDISSDNGAVAILSCFPDFEVAGQSKTYCDGQQWDRSLGICRAIKDKDSTATHCDFEVANLCGWVSDSSNNYDWKRGSGPPIGSRLQIMGPLFDHTTKERFQGHFMIAENINRVEHDAARLISPMYTADQSKDSCFRFYSHIFGKAAGQLRIWLKPASVPISSVLENIKYLQFVGTGEYKNYWLKNIIELNTLSENFQIIIEAKSHGSGLSDIAIDDVALLQGAECLNDKDLVTRPTPQVEEHGIYDVQSCTNRCNELPPPTDGPIINRQTVIQNGTGKGSILILCDCFNGCDALQTCCLDYIDTCIFDSTTEMSDDYSEESTAVQTTTELTTSTIGITKITKKIIPATFPTVKLTTKTINTTTTEKIPTTPTIKSSSLTIKLIKATTPTSTATTTTKQTTQRLITTPTTTKSIITTKKQIIPTMITTKLTTTATITSSAPLLTTSVTTSANNELITEESVIAVEPVNTKMHINNNKTNYNIQRWHSSKETPDSDTLSSNLLLIFLLVTLLVLILISSVAILYKKYRQNPLDYRSSSSRCGPSDEVKFLTNNEQLAYEYTNGVSN